MSSNLILPSAYTNPLLENNLNALFRRYPHERARLESILRKPAPSQALPTIELPAAPSNPPIRILLLRGIGNPLFLAQLLNDSLIQKECYKLFIFEQNPEFLAFSFQNADLTQIINYDRTEWFLLQTKESLKPALFRALKPESVTSMMLNVQLLDVVPASDQSIIDFYESLGSLYDETARHILHNHGNLEDSLLGIDVTVENKDYLLNNPGIDDLKSAYKGASALIVGAGPSLDQNLDTIKKYNDRFVIIAADAALKPLLNHGIRVDYCTSIERLNAYQVPFFTDLNDVTTDLVAFPVVHPDVLALYPGTVRMCYRNYSFYAYFEKAYPKGIIRCGGSTSHLAMRLADWMGCKRAFMIGLDSCYEEKDGLFRSHCSGTGHPDWGAFVELSEFNKTRRHPAPMKAINNLGEETTTNMTYYQWVKEYAEELSSLGQRMQILNCSATGLAIDGIPFISLEEASKDLDVNYIEKPIAPKASYTRSWDNSELLKNFQSWLQASKDGIKEADELLAMEAIDYERYQVIHYLFNFRMCIDDLFVAFVIQCAALRFFELENIWWSLSLDPNKDLKEKVSVLRGRFSLFVEALESLIKIFEKEEMTEDGK